MYHEDKGRVVDVELLAECGQIAQHLRQLERQWKIDLKDLQKQSVRGFVKPPIPTTESVKENLNRIFNLNEEHLVGGRVHDTDLDEFDEEFVKHVRHLEDVVIKIYQLKQKNQRIAGGGDCLDDNSSSQPAECINSSSNSSAKADIKSNMNYSAAGAAAENNELKASPTTSPTTDTRDDQHFEAHLWTQKQQQQQTETTTASMIATIESSGCDNNNQSLMNNDSDKQEQDLNIGDVGYIDKQQQQQQLLAKISCEDFKVLLREMKRKVEFTEKMNWLCKLSACARDIRCFLLV